MYTSVRNFIFIILDLRLRKAWPGDAVHRAKSTEQSGKLSEFALDSGFSYVGELRGSRHLVTTFLNKISEMILNEAEIKRNPLDDYVWMEDDNFSFSHEKSTRNADSVVHHVKMISQKWQNETLLINPDHTFWQHRLDIIIPVNLADTDIFLLHVTSQNIPLDFDSYHSDTVRTQLFAENLGVVAAVLYQVPNQPLNMVPIPGVKYQDVIYAGGRTEDGILARCWREFINNYIEKDVEDHTILVQMPMAKAAVRALETVTEFVYDKTGNYMTKAGVTGASKRGWTTWLTAAADYERVDFMAPVYFDELNMVENIHHHFRSLGGYTWTFLDYYYAGITEYLDHPAVNASRLVLDVLTFKDRYAKHQVNYMITAGNDEFFLVDNPNYFYNELDEKTLMRIIPNQGRVSL